MLASLRLLCKSLSLPEFLGMLYALELCFIGYLELSGCMSAWSRCCKEEIAQDFYRELWLGV